MTNEEKTTVGEYLVFYDDPTKSADKAEAAVNDFCTAEGLDIKVVRKLERMGFVFVSTTRAVAEQISKKCRGMLVSEVNGKKYTRV